MATACVGDEEPKADAMLQNAAGKMASAAGPASSSSASQHTMVGETARQSIAELYM